MLPVVKRQVTYPVKWFQEQVPKKREKRGMIFFLLTIMDSLFPHALH